MRNLNIKLMDKKVYVLLMFFIAYSTFADLVTFIKDKDHVYVKQMQPGDTLVTRYSYGYPKEWFSYNPYKYTTFRIKNGMIGYADTYYHFDVKWLDGNYSGTHKVYKYTSSPAYVPRCNFNLKTGQKCHNHTFNMKVIIEMDPCVCTDCVTGDSSANNSSLHYKINLGTTKYGKAVGYLELERETINSSITKPQGLKVRIFNGEKLYNSGVISQIYSSAQGLVNFVVENDNKYTMNFYTPENVRTKVDGYYTFTEDSEFRSIVVENPLVDSVYDTNTILFSNTRKKDGGSSNKLDTFVWEETTSMWGLITGTDDNTRKEFVSRELVNGDIVKTHTIKNSNDGIISKTIKKYHLYNWNKPNEPELIELIEDPDGQVLTTTYEFSTSFPNHGELIKQINPNGTWIKYEYNGLKVTKEITPFGNTAHDTEIIDEVGVKVTEYQYDGSTITIIKRVNGIEISRSFKIETAAGTTIITPAFKGADITNLANARDISYYHTSGDYQGKLISIENANGIMSFYNYEIVGELKITTSYTGVPNVAKTVIIDGTKSESKNNEQGRHISSKTWAIKEGQSDILISSEIMSNFDEFGRSLTSTYIDGTSTHVTYTCCGPDSQTDKAGTVTNIGYDSLQRESLRSRDGITSFYSYDANSNIIATTQKGKDATEFTSTNIYNLAGQQTSSTDPMGNTTTHNNGFIESVYTETTTNPDGSTIITKYNVDGSPAETIGTATQHIRYEYGINETTKELYTKTIPLKADGSDEEQWTKTYTNFLGRQYKTIFADETPADESDNPKYISYFDNLGREIKKVSPTGKTTLIAYNAKGESFRTATDMNSNDIIDLDGTDIVSESESLVTSKDSDFVHKNISYIYADGGVKLETSMNERNVTGLQNWNTSFGKTANSATSYDGGGQKTITQTNIDGSTTTQIYLNGILMSTDNSITGITTLNYDSHNRLSSRIFTEDSIEKTVFYTYNSNGEMTSQTDPETRVTSFTYNNMGQNTQVTSPSGVLNMEYALTGEMIKKYGDDVYPHLIGFDNMGRRTSLTTYKDYDTTSGEAITTFTFDSLRGFKSVKTYADGKSTNYTYYANGQLQKRNWARGIDTDYIYNNAGALSSITYSDGSTAPISYLRDSQNRPTSITDGTGTHNFIYHNDSTIDTVSIPYVEDHAIDYDYDLLGLRTQLQLKDDTTPISTVNYDYDGGSRLDTITNGAISATFTRVLGSNLIETIEYKNGGSTVLTVTRSYDILNRLISIISVDSVSSVVKSFVYEYNDSDQRIKTTLEDNTYWTYVYNAKGELIKGQRYNENNTKILGYAFDYSYDDIGNRITSASNSNISNYTSNNINQYTQRTIPNKVIVHGTANSLATVTVNNKRTERNEEFFSKKLTFDNSSSNVDENVTIIGVRNNIGASGEDAVTEEIKNVFIPKTPQVMNFDDDGNLLSDNVWNYTWNGENRLIETEKADTKLDFMYDYMGRRTQKQVYSGSVGDWTLDKHLKFTYDNFKLIAEFDVLDSNNIIRKYTWSGETPIAMTDIDGTFLYILDGNKNVTALIDTAGNIRAEYIYDPFGKTLSMTGDKAKDNPIRFSSEYYDKETNLI